MQDFERLVRNFVENSVEFVIVGGFAAVVHGSSLVTEDLDICIPFTEENANRLIKVLKPLHPRHRLVGR